MKSNAARKTKGCPNSLGPAPQVLKDISLYMYPKPVTCKETKPAM